jgi:ATP-dependent DNA helicase RecG
MPYETEKIEFKEIVTDDIYKEVIAFANTDGGTLSIGINKSGEAAPLADVDGDYTRITNGIRDAIAPDVTIFVKYTLEENRIVRIDVGEGSYKPYYLKSKGLKPSGVYVRQGASSVPASPEQIRQMIKNADGDMFEDLRALEQSLTFRCAADTFSKHGLEFGEDKYYALGVRSSTQNLYTNLGLLLSDQCAHTVKVAVFSDENNTVFRDRKEFAGSIFEQLEETFSYLQLCNQNRSVIDGLERIDYWDYPQEAIREALINALIHRDYSFSGSVIININDKEIEFISIGGLLAGLSPEDIRNGISQPRNRKLAEVFHRLRFIESYGTGIRRIYSLYKDCAELPTIEVTPQTFKITLPNRSNSAQAAHGSQRPKQTVTPQMQVILTYLAEHGELSDTELQELLSIKRTRAFTLTKQMQGDGLISIVGRGADKKYVIGGKRDGA